MINAEQLPEVVLAQGARRTNTLDILDLHLWIDTTSCHVTEQFLHNEKQLISAKCNFVMVHLLRLAINLF